MVEIAMTFLKRATDSSSYYRQNRNIKEEFMRARECAKVLPLQADTYQHNIRLKTKKIADLKLTAENTDYQVKSVANRVCTLQASNEEVSRRRQVQKLIDEHLRRETINSNDEFASTLW
ncbi:hypothetical protein AC1031_004625 [Aphanomyces cochlioides]|nr:hypothetical protein AC1031_004625 [Aphanomyces cochlioides]